MISYDKLEKERREKIRNLNPDETEAYIDSLNDKIYQALANKNYEKQNYYNDKLVEAGLILKEKYSNIPMVISTSKLSYVSADLICERIKLSISDFHEVFQMVIDLTYHIFNLKAYLEDILHIYYFHYSNRIGNSVISHLEDDLWTQLDEKTFNKVMDIVIKKDYSEDFYHNMLLKSLDRLIEAIRDDFFRLINLGDKYEDVYEKLSVRIENSKANFENEKEYIFKNLNDKPVKILKEKGYLDLLLEEIEIMSNFHEGIKEYLKLKNVILDVINGDAFGLIKEIDYSTMCKRKEKYDFLSCPSKEDFMNSRPSYDIKHLKLIKPEKD